VKKMGGERMNTWKRTGVLAAGAAVVIMAQAGLAIAGEIVWWTPNWGEARAKELAAKFQAANPGVTIKMEVTVSNGLAAKVATALRSGSPPDLIEVQHGWGPEYARGGLVLPLDDVLKDKDDYVPAALDYVTWNGKLWG